MLRAGCPEDLLGVVPYLLGFHPTESMVLLALRRRSVELVARVDLPGSGLGPGTGTVTPAAWPAIVARLAAAARSVGPSGVVLIGYSTVAGRAEDALDGALDELGDLPVIEVLHADGRRWWSRRCDDDCCPAEGTPYAVDESRLAAEAVLAGLSPLPDRSALVQAVAGPPLTEVAVLEAEAVALVEQLQGLPRSVRAAEMRRRVEAVVYPDEHPDGHADEHAEHADEHADVHTDEAHSAERLADQHPDGQAGDGVAAPDRSTCLRLAALATDLDVRDVGWALIDPASWRQHVALWSAVVRVCPPVLAPAPLCLLGAAAWVGGQGALMVCAFARALELRPEYGMARLLADLNTAALPPSLWQEVAGPLRESLGIEVDLDPERAAGSVTGAARAVGGA